MAPKKSKPVPQEEPSSEEVSSDEEFDEEMEDEEEEFDLIEAMNEMNLAERRKVYALKGIQEEYNELMVEYRLELAALELALHKKREVDFERRRKIVNGEEEVTATEVEAGKKEVSSGKIEEIESDDEDKKKPRKGVKVVAPKDVAKSDKGVPDFWLHAMKHSEQVGQSITEKDTELLSCITDIVSSYVDDKPELGFQLVFHFAENEYFTNKTLTKRCLWNQERKGDEEQIDKMEGTKIDWTSPEKNTCVVIKEKKQRHKSGKGVRIVKKEEKCESFFRFFDPIQLDEDGQPVGKFEPEEEEQIEELISQDEDVTLALHSTVVPRAAYYFTGEPMAKQAQALREMFGMEGMDDDEEDEAFEDEDSEESEEETKPAAKRGGGGGGRGGAQKPGGKRGGGGGHVDPAAQDCKQQ